MRKTLRLSMHSMRLLVIAAAVSASSLRSKQDVEDSWILISCPQFIGLNMVPIY